MKRAFSTFAAIHILFCTLSAQVVETVQWTFSSKPAGNNMYDLVFKADIKENWHLYGLHIDEGGPIPVSVNFNDSSGFKVAGPPTQYPEPEIVDDKIFNMPLELHNKQATFTQRIKITQPGNVEIKGTLEYMTCSDIQCVLGDRDFEFSLKGPSGEPISEVSLPVITETLSSDSITGNSSSISKNTGTSLQAGSSGSNRVKKSLWGVFLLAMVAGLGGLLTPCVYPMIPMTVSFFLRDNKSRAKSISEAVVFGLSIVFIYTLIGILVAVFKNPNAVNNFTTHWITNLLFFIIFIILSASFFGMFEIILPSGLANKVDQKADKGGFAGAFFMALAMAILSFSCTGPIVASLLIKASQGEVLEPVVGMAGFSVVFAIPFTLFAIFPSWLQNLPKSGSWLNGVKVFFAFMMLAFSLYFLGKIDQAYNLHFISRNVFISIWMVISILLGFYFLGKIKFAHDSDLPHLGFPRLLLVVVCFSFTLYLFTGLLGNDLKPLSALLPPAMKNSPAISSNESTDATTGTVNLCGIPKYAGFLTLPNHIQGYYDYEEALACARQQGKPVLVDFVGHTCSNCKKMYSEVWSDPGVIELLNENFIVVALYTDDKTKLPDTEQYTSAVDGKLKNTIGKKNQDLQIGRFNSNALPLYAIVDTNGNDLSKSYYTYNPDTEQFIEWLKSVLNR